MQKTIIAGIVLVAGLLSWGCLTEAKPAKDEVKVKTAAQAINIARLHYINGRRGIRYSGKPETIINWKKPKVTRSRSRQNNLLWDIHFDVPNEPGVLPGDDFAITVAENGKVVRIIQAYD